MKRILCLIIISILLIGNRHVLSISKHLNETSNINSFVRTPSKFAEGSLYIENLKAQIELRQILKDHFDLDRQFSNEVMSRERIYGISIKKLRNNKLKICDLDGKPLIAQKFDEVKLIKPIEGKLYILCRQGRVWKIINVTENVVEYESKQQVSDFEVVNGVLYIQSLLLGKSHTSYIRKVQGEHNEILKGFHTMNLFSPKYLYIFRETLDYVWEYLLSTKCIEYYSDRQYYTCSPLVDFGPGPFYEKMSPMIGFLGEELITRILMFLKRNESEEYYEIFSKQRFLKEVFGIGDFRHLMAEIRKVKTINGRVAPLVDLNGLINLKRLFSLKGNGDFKILEQYRFLKKLILQILKANRARMQLIRAGEDVYAKFENDYGEVILGLEPGKVGLPPIARNQRVVLQTENEAVVKFRLAGEDHVRVLGHKIPFFSHYEIGRVLGDSNGRIYVEYIKTMVIEEKEIKNRENEVVGTRQILGKRAFIKEFVLRDGFYTENEDFFDYGPYDSMDLEVCDIKTGIVKYEGELSQQQVLVYKKRKEFSNIFEYYIDIGLELMPLGPYECAPKLFLIDGIIYLLHTENIKRMSNDGTYETTGQRFKVRILGDETNLFEYTPRRSNFEVKGLVKVEGRLCLVEHRQRRKRHIELLRDLEDGSNVYETYGHIMVFKQPVNRKSQNYVIIRDFLNNNLDKILEFYQVIDDESRKVFLSNVFRIDELGEIIRENFNTSRFIQNILMLPFDKIEIINSYLSNLKGDFLEVLLETYRGSYLSLLIQIDEFESEEDFIFWFQSIIDENRISDPRLKLDLEYGKIFKGDFREIDVIGFLKEYAETGEFDIEFLGGESYLKDVVCELLDIREISTEQDYFDIWQKIFLLRDKSSDGDNCLEILEYLPNVRHLLLLNKGRVVFKENPKRGEIKRVVILDKTLMLYREITLVSGSVKIELITSPILTHRKKRNSFIDKQKIYRFLSRFFSYFNPSDGSIVLVLNNKILDLLKDNKINEENVFDFFDNVTNVLFAV